TNSQNRDNVLLGQINTNLTTQIGINNATSDKIKAVDSDSQSRDGMLLNQVNYNLQSQAIVNAKTNVVIERHTINIEDNTNRIGSLESSLSATNKQVSQNTADIKELRGGIASTAAIGILDLNHKEIGFGFASYKGVRSYAIGTSFEITNNLTGTIAVSSDETFKAPVSAASLKYKF
ncbi:MAG: hypothetical protein GY928_31460, partial [Colwellia sp.]|nr:hypothetical protein [Colwellia sp.]